jgi:hypothetical protein
VVSIEARSCFTIVLARDRHPTDVQHLAGHANIQLTLNSYSHEMPSMGGLAKDYAGQRGDVVLDNSAQ